MDVVLVAFAALLVVGLVLAFGLAIARWRGVWRLLAILVVLALVSHAIKVVFDIQRDPTSHNLWPFEVVILSAGALVLLGVFALVRPKAPPAG